MPNAMQIKKTMLEKEVAPEIMMCFNFPKSKGNQPEEVIALISQMDELLTPELRLSVMEEQGCCKTGRNDPAHRAFGREHAEKTIEEKVKLINQTDIPYNVPCKLNDDGTLSVFWGAGQEGNYNCVCRMIRKLQKSQSQPLDVTPTFCGCCGGHVRHNFQNSLGVTLRLKEIVSSPISSGGKKRCEFLFEIIGNR